MRKINVTSKVADKVVQQGAKPDSTSRQLLRPLASAIRSTLSGMSHALAARVSAEDAARRGGAGTSRATAKLAEFSRMAKNMREGVRSNIPAGSGVEGPSRSPAALIASSLAETSRFKDRSFDERLKLAEIGVTAWGIAMSLRAKVKAALRRPSPFPRPAVAETPATGPAHARASTAKPGFLARQYLQAQLLAMMDAKNAAEASMAQDRPEDAAAQEQAQGLAAPSTSDAEDNMTAAPNPALGSGASEVSEGGAEGLKPPAGPVAGLGTGEPAVHGMDSTGVRGPQTAAPAGGPSWEWPGREIWDLDDKAAKASFDQQRAQRRKRQLLSERPPEDAIADRRLWQPLFEAAVENEAKAARMLEYVEDEREEFLADGIDPTVYQRQAKGASELTSTKGSARRTGTAGSSVHDTHAAGAENKKGDASADVCSWTWPGLDHWELKDQAEQAVFDQQRAQRRQRQLLSEKPPEDALGANLIWAPMFEEAVHLETTATRKLAHAQHELARLHSVYPGLLPSPAQMETGRAAARAPAQGAPGLTDSDSDSDAGEFTPPSTRAVSPEPESPRDRQAGEFMTYPPRPPAGGTLRPDDSHAVTQAKVPKSIEASRELMRRGMAIESGHQAAWSDQQRARQRQRELMAQQPPDGHSGLDAWRQQHPDWQASFDQAVNEENEATRRMESAAKELIDHQDRMASDGELDTRRHG